MYECGCTGARYRWNTRWRLSLEYMGANKQRPIILALIDYKLSCRQAKFPRILSPDGQNDLEGQSQWPPFSIPAKRIPGCIFRTNLMIPAQICNELSCRQAKVYARKDRQMDGQTDRQRQRQYPFGLKGQGVKKTLCLHYDDAIMGAIGSQITSLTIVYSTVYSGADQSKHQSSASLAFVWGIHRGPVNSPHKWPVTRKMFPFDDVIM